MQTAAQRRFKTGSKHDRRSTRDKTIAAIHITWSKIRRDLKGDKEELRTSRLAFMSDVLKRDVKSSRDVTDAKLGKVLDAMRELERAPGLFGVSSSEFRVQSATANSEPVTAEIVHLATDAQVEAINKLFRHLGWSLEAIEGFISKRFKTKSHRLLTPKQANSLTMILLTIAASAVLRKRGMQRVSRRMIGIEIPSIKRLLDIDQRVTTDRRPQTDQEEYDDEAF